MRVSPQPHSLHMRSHALHSLSPTGCLSLTLPRFTSTLSYPPSHTACILPPTHTLSMTSPPPPSHTHTYTSLYLAEVAAARCTLLRP